MKLKEKGGKLEGTKKAMVNEINLQQNIRKIKMKWTRKNINANNLERKFNFKKTEMPSVAAIL